MSEQKPLNLALIGLGNHMYKRLYPLTVGLPIRLVAVCDRDAEKCRRFSGKFYAENTYADYTEMLERAKPDAVMCAGNAQLHYEVAKKCMNMGISPFIEKTPCETYSQALELLELQRKTGCFTMVGFNRRFTTSYEMAKEIINRQEFGGAHLYMAKYHSSAYPSDEYFLFNHVIHHLDLARYLLGEIVNISAEKIVVSKGIVGYHIKFETCNGALGFIESSSLQREDYPMERVEITGYGCNVIVDNVKGLEYNRTVSEKLTVSPKLIDNKDLCGWNYNHGHSSLYGHYGFEKELGIYVNAVLGKIKPISDFEEIAGTMKLYDDLLKHCKLVNFKTGGI